MNCRNVEQNLSAFLDNELTGSQMLIVRRHIEECRACQTELEGLRALHNHMRGLPNIAPSVPSHADMMRTIRERKPRVREKVHAAGMIAVSSAAAAILAVALFYRLNNETPVVDRTAPFTASSDMPYVSGGDLGGLPVQPVSYEQK